MLSKFRILGVLLSVLIAGSIMTGCKKNDDGRTKLSVLYYLDATEANSVVDAKWYFDEFAKANPDVVIQREDLFNEPFHDKTKAYAASGNLPDVLYVWPSGRSGYLHDERLLKDLSPLIKRDNLERLYLPLTMDPSQQQAGYLAMIPQGITATHAFFINMEVLDDCGLQPARTYAELKAQVPVLKAKGYETVLMPNKDTWVMQSCLFSAIAGRFCGEGWDQRILSGQAKFTDPDFVAALDFIRQLYADGVIPQSALGTDYGDGPGLFATNKGAYYIDGDWRVGNFLTDADTGQALISPARQNNIRISVFPDIEGAKINKSSSVILGTGWAMSAAIPEGSAKEDAAWRLVKWLSGKEASTLRTEHGGTPTPSRTDLDYKTMSLEPMQIAIGKLGDEFTAATIVIDGVFQGDVYEPINDGLVELGIGAKTAQQVASEVQRAFDAGRSAGKW
jgi:raffinose/stachyose/melibiose transport system substrate-binding protein